MRRLAILALFWLILAVAATLAVSCGPPPARDEPVLPARPSPVLQLTGLETSSGSIGMKGAVR